MAKSLGTRMNTGFVGVFSGRATQENERNDMNSKQTGQIKKRNF